MRIIDLYGIDKKSGYYDSDKNRWVGLKMINGFVPKKQFWNSLQIKKANTEFPCRICEKKCPRKTRYIGSNYEKICFLCAEEWVKNSAIICDEIKRVILENGKMILENKEKWKDEMLLGAL